MSRFLGSKNLKEGGDFMKKYPGLFLAIAVVMIAGSVVYAAKNPDSFLIKCTPSYTLSVKVSTPEAGIDFGSVQTNRYYVATDTAVIENDSPETGRAIEYIHLSAAAAAGNTWDLDGDNTASPDKLRIYACFAKNPINGWNAGPQTTRSTDLGDEDLVTATNQNWAGNTGGVFDPATSGLRYSDGRIPNDTETYLTRILYIGIGTASATSIKDQPQTFILNVTADIDSTP